MNKTRTRKKAATMTAGLAALLMLSGTFAWTSISQQALNDNENRTEAGGRVHDDYDKASGNKDIYAENYSKQSLVVRIKLSEYLEGDSTPLIAGTTKAGYEKWTPYGMPESADSNKFRPYVKWTLGGEKAYLPTFNTDKNDLSIDVKGDAKNLTGSSTAVGTGENGEFIAGTEYAADATIGGTGSKKTAKNTLKEDRAPISIETWKNYTPDQQNGNYWVIDTDGWAYWANLLPAGESTSLLLNQLTWNDPELSKHEEWYYGIHVVGEFATVKDMDKFNTSEFGKPSADSLKLINSITGEDSEATKPGTEFDFYGETYIYLKDLGEGNSLVLRKNLLNKYVSTSVLYNGSALDEAMKEYYNGLSAEAKNAVQPVQKVFDIGAPNKEIKLDNDRFLAEEPTEDYAKVTEGAAGEKKAFALSVAEINEVSGPGKVFPNLASRGAVKADGTPFYYWLRSPASDGAAWYISSAENNGKFNGYTVSYENGIRPALIIKR